MTPLVFTLVLTSASLHVLWNALVKASKQDKASFAWLTSVAQMVMLLPVFLVARLWWPGPICGQLWALAALSGLLEGTYLILLFEAYRRTDLSVVYPLSRGIAPMVAMCAGTWLVGDSLAFWPAVAVVTITVGVFGVSLSTRQARMESRHLEGILLAAATGGMIAGYHIVDRQAMKLTPSPNRLEYLYLLHLFMAVVVTFWMCISKKRRRSMLTAWTSDWRGVLIVSLLLPTSYFMILLALSYSNVTYVTAGRNVGILISTAVGAMLLREKATGPRLIGILLIACGVVALVWLRGH